MEFNVLIEKMLESPYLYEVKNNSTQFILNEEQIKFLCDFKKFTNKEIDCQIAIFQNIDYKTLLNKVRESSFILKNSNLNLKWILSHAEEICNDKYKNYYKFENANEQEVKFKQRKYTFEELNNFFQDVDSIDV